MTQESSAVENKEPEQQTGHAEQKSLLRMACEKSIQLVNAFVDYFVKNNEL